MSSDEHTEDSIRRLEEAGGEFDKPLGSEAGGGSSTESAPECVWTAEEMEMLLESEEARATSEGEVATTPLENALNCLDLTISTRGDFERVAGVILAHIEALSPATGRAPVRNVRSLLNVFDTMDWVLYADQKGEPLWSEIAQRVLESLADEMPIDQIANFLPTLCQRIVEESPWRVCAAIGRVVKPIVGSEFTALDEAEDSWANADLDR